ncbi:MAG: polyprenyl synthetase family protein, partial [Bacteroidota bacterium]|nr:polyprenyl synthetase family protein [Bacteroidota bacterium]
AFCTQAGAISVDAEEKSVETLRLFGEYVGMIFQIKDDIFDYFDSGLIGKPTCNDLKEGKMTLPLIYSLKNANMAETKPFLNMIRNKDFSHENLSNINRFVMKAGGVEYAEKRMDDFKQLAVQALDIFPDSPYKQAMLACLDYFMKRKY